MATLEQMLRKEVEYVELLTDEALHSYVKETEQCLLQMLRQVLFLFCSCVKLRH